MNLCLKIKWHSLVMNVSLTTRSFNTQISTRIAGLAKSDGFQQLPKKYEGTHSGSIDEYKGPRVEVQDARIRQPKSKISGFTRFKTM